MKKIILILLLFTSCLVHERTTTKVTRKGDLILTETTITKTTKEKIKKRTPKKGEPRYTFKRERYPKKLFR